MNPLMRAKSRPPIEERQHRRARRNGFYLPQSRPILTLLKVDTSRCQRVDQTNSRGSVLPAARVRAARLPIVTLRRVSPARLGDWLLLGNQLREWKDRNGSQADLVIVPPHARSGETGVNRVSPVATSFSTPLASANSSQ